MYKLTNIRPTELTAGEKGRGKEADRQAEEGGGDLTVPPQIGG